MNKKIFKEKPKSSKKIQQKISPIEVPFTEIHQIYEPHLPKRQTNILEFSIIAAGAMALVLACALSLHYLKKNEKEKKETEEKPTPIIVKIVNSAPLFKNGKSYQSLMWEDSLKYTGKSSSCFIVSANNPIWKLVTPQDHQRFFFGIYSWRNIIENYGIDSHYFEKNDKIELLGMQCFLCSFADFDLKNKPKKCYCHCNKENWKEKHICD